MLLLWSSTVAARKKATPLLVRDQCIIIWLYTNYAEGTLQRMGVVQELVICASDG